MLITVIVGVALLFVVLLANNSYSDRLIRERLDTTMDNMSDLAGEYMELRIRKSDKIAIDIAGNEEAAILSSIYLAESDTFQTLSNIKEDVLEQISYHAPANEEIDSINLYYKGRRSFINSNGTISKTDNPEVMANQVIELLSNESLRHTMAISARKFVEENYRWENTYGKIHDCLEKAITNHKEKFRVKINRVNTDERVQ